jgi:hypothetical protein
MPKTYLSTVWKQTLTDLALVVGVKLITDFNFEKLLTRASPALTTGTDSSSVMACQVIKVVKPEKIKINKNVMRFFKKIKIV